LKPRIIAFHLPQFHPIPENDRWWGKGFTEWTNVIKGKPLFRGHYQPHLPADLGFYDLRSADARAAQANLARQYGISAFCYFHYWFQGRQLLEQPVNEILASGQPDFPFCLCWANENWTRLWDGLDQQVLMEQTYSEEDDLAHIRWLANAFRDPRYLRVNGKPLFIIYRASALPNPKRTYALWREQCRQMGIGEIFLCRIETSRDTQSPTDLGLDAAVEFQPECNTVGPPLTGRRFAGGSTVYHSYRALSRRVRPTQSYRLFPCVTPGWDNSPRRSTGATVYVGSTPLLFEKWLAESLAQESKSEGDKLVFINAWNEWAEGNHLEPDQRYGLQYLEAVRRAAARL
jgi:lipopolysaccharide biosynthesis protein